jgi:hypothetical protein
VHHTGHYIHLPPGLTTLARGDGTPNPDIATDSALREAAPSFTTGDPIDDALPTLPLAMVDSALMLLPLWPIISASILFSSPRASSPGGGEVASLSRSASDDLLVCSAWKRCQSGPLLLATTGEVNLDSVVALSGTEGISSMLGSGGGVGSASLLDVEVACTLVAGTVEGGRDRHCVGALGFAGGCAAESLSNVAAIR